MQQKRLMLGGTQHISGYGNLCTTKLLSMLIKLGGPGKVVQIDENLFKHKPKVNAWCN